MAARDRFLHLPDRLICDHILTKLPLKQVIQCSTVSRRWKRFWTLLPTLRFTYEFFSSLRPAIDVDVDVCEKIIDNILLLRTEHIESFELQCNISSFEIISLEKIRQWVLSVASKGVRELTLRTDQDMDDVEVSSALNSCDRLVFIRLDGISITRTPAWFGGFQCLKMFHICDASLNEEAFKLLVKLCPLLETLRVGYCIVIKNLTLDSQSLNTLHLEVLDIKPSFFVRANCPQLTNLIMRDCASVRELVVNCPSLVHLATTESRILEKIPIMKSLRKLILVNAHNVNVSHKFPNIEELCIKDWESANILALEMKLPCLKKVHIISTGNVVVLSHLLKAPSVETVIISLTEGHNSLAELQFVNQDHSFIVSRDCKKVICRNCKEFSGYI